MKLMSNAEYIEGTKLVDDAVECIKKNMLEADELNSMALRIMYTLESYAKVSDDPGLAELYGKASELYAKTYMHSMTNVRVACTFDRLKIFVYKK